MVEIKQHQNKEYERKGTGKETAIERVKRPRDREDKEARMKFRRT